MKTLPEHYTQALAFALTSPGTQGRQLFLEKLYVFVSHGGNERLRTEGRVYLEVFEKVGGGVAFANGWLKENRNEIYEFLVNLGQSGLQRVSPRPYRLGQACDGTIGWPVLHAFKVGCDALGLEASALHRAAYPNEEVPDWNEAQLHAEWQGGVVWPESWNAQAITALGDSLTEINYHSLRAKFEEALTRHRAEEQANVYGGMDDPDLETALGDLSRAIREITLGGIEHVLIEEAGESLIRNWNDHDPVQHIDEARELQNWARACQHLG